jgi:5,10-methylenetetrahydromethanopterin reductase
MTMRLGIRFDGFVPAREAMETARGGEEAGAHSIWHSGHLGYRDPIVACMALLHATKRAMVVPTSISPYLWHPMPTAMSFATMAELAPGRVGIAVSVGNVLNLRQSGAEPEKPVRAIRDYVAALRALWAGETVRMESLTFRLDGARLAFTPKEPITVYVASSGPQVLALSGRIADGVLLSGGLSLAYTRQCLEHVEDGARKAGRDPAALRRAGFIYMNVSENGTDAVAAMRRKLGYLFRNRPQAANIASAGLPIDHDAIIAANAKHDLDTAAALVPEEAVDAFAVAGTPAHCRAQLEKYLAVGLEEPVIEIAGSEKDKALARDIVREFAAG